LAVFRAAWRGDLPLTTLSLPYVSDYLLLPEGEKHSAYYEHGREQARKNLGDIKAALGRGEDITEQVLLRLLPYSDTPFNRDQGNWISIAPDFSANEKIKFEAAGWRKEGWQDEEELWPREFFLGE
jgi:5-methylcytosine-specific restriction protein B